MFHANRAYETGLTERTRALLANPPAPYGEEKDVALCLKVWTKEKDNNPYIKHLKHQAGYRARKRRAIIGPSELLRRFAPDFCWMTTEELLHMLEFVDVSMSKDSFKQALSWLVKKKEFAMRPLFSSVGAGEKCGRRGQPAQYLRIKDYYAYEKEGQVGKAAQSGHRAWLANLSQRSGTDAVSESP